MGDEKARALVGEVLRAQITDNLTSMGQPSDVVGIVVQKQLATQVRGFVLALRRLRAALETTPNNPDDIYIYLIEACQWLDIVAEREGLAGDVDVQAISFARDRSQHQWASTVGPSSTRRWVWREADILPASLLPNHQGGKKRRWYESRLAGETVTDVFDRLEAKIIALAPTSDLS